MSLNKKELQNEAYNFQMELVIEIEKLRKENRELRREVKAYEYNDIHGCVENKEFVEQVKKIFMGL